MPLTFAVTYDYLCPFARNVHEHMLDGLAAGADWDVTFTPFSQSQGHVEHGGTDVWDREDPNAVSGLLAMQAGIAVRDHDPDRFPEVHRELFAARHDRGEDIRDRDVVAKALAAGGADVAATFAIVDGGGPLATIRDEHRHNADDLQIWGVPTFIAGGRAVFVRLLERPTGADEAIRRIERVVDLVAGEPDLHEFKQVDLPF